MAKSGVGTRTWRKTRERILRRDGYICQYCGQEADTVDHVIPRRLGATSPTSATTARCRRGPATVRRGRRVFGVLK